MEDVRGSALDPASRPSGFFFSVSIRQYAVLDRIEHAAVNEKATITKRSIWLNATEIYVLLGRSRLWVQATLRSFCPPGIIRGDPGIQMASV